MYRECNLVTRRIFALRNFYGERKHFEGDIVRFMGKLCGNIAASLIIYDSQRQSAIIKGNFNQISFTHLKSRETKGIAFKLLPEEEKIKEKPY
jgi:hypothetical protein